MNYRSILIVCLATLGLAVAGWGQGVTSSGGGAWVAGVIHRLTDHSANYRDPSWSPDGRHIAFDSNRGDKAEIYVMGSDGSNPRRLTDHPAWAALPSWSPDGRHIAFVSERGVSDGGQPLRDRFGWEQPPQPDQRLGLGLVSLLVSGWPTHRLRVPAR